MFARLYNEGRNRHADKLEITLAVIIVEGTIAVMCGTGLSSLSLEWSKQAAKKRTSGTYDQCKMLYINAQTHKRQRLPRKIRGGGGEYAEQRPEKDGAVLII